MEFVMTNQSIPRPFHLREYRLDDIPAFTNFINRTFPDEPTTVKNMEHWERIYPKDNPPILRMNEKLGYRRLPGWLVWKKLPQE